VNHKAPKEVETVIPTVLERGGEYFRELWKSLTDSDLLAAALARSQSPPGSSPRGNSRTTRQSVLRKLERKEILEKT